MSRSPQSLTHIILLCAVPTRPQATDCHFQIDPVTKKNTSYCPSVFPSALTSSAAFNDTLFTAIGAAISAEARGFTNIEGAKNTSIAGQKNNTHQICWSPDINPHRHPLWGRGQEVPGEDA